MKQAIAGLILLLSSPLVLARQADLVDPVLVPIPEGRSTEDVDKAARAAFGKNEWYLERDTADQLVMVWDDGNTHIAKVGVSHDEHSLTIRYVDSEVMDYEESDAKRRIHPLYNSLVAAVAGDLTQFLDKGVPENMDLSAQRAEKMAAIIGSPGSPKSLFGRTRANSWHDPWTLGVVVTSVDADSWLFGKKVVKVRPGRHTVDLRCPDCMPITGVTAHLWFVASPGGHYTGRAEGFDKQGLQFKVRMTVVDDATGLPTGGVQESSR